MEITIDVRLTGPLMTRAVKALEGIVAHLDDLRVVTDEVGQAVAGMGVSVRDAADRIAQKLDSLSSNQVAEADVAELRSLLAPLHGISDSIAQLGDDPATRVPTRDEAAPLDGLDTGENPNNREPVPTPVPAGAGDSPAGAGDNEAEVPEEGDPAQPGSTTGVLLDPGFTSEKGDDPDAEAPVLTDEDFSDEDDVEPDAEPDVVDDDTEAEPNS